MLTQCLLIILIHTNFHRITQGEAVNTTVINSESDVMNISTPIVNDENNSTSTAAPPPDSIIESVPTWAWVTVGIISALMLCCLCCCPQTLCAIFCCPFLFAIDIILLPVNCCLCCLGFESVGPRGGSLAAAFQSCCYGGNTPSGSCFSCLQSCAMK